MEGFRSLVLRFLEVQGFAKSTREIYSRHLNALADYDPTGPLRPGTIQAYLMSLKPHSKKKAWHCLNRFCAWLIIEGQLKSSPVASIPKPKAIAEPKKGMTRDDLARLFAALSEGLNTNDPIHYFSSLRLSIMVKLITYYGVRTGEILELRDNALDLMNKRAWFTRKGNDRTVTVNLHDDLVEDFYKYRELARGKREGLHDRVFITWRGNAVCHHTIYSQMTKLSERAGLDLETRGLHQLRHTMAGILLDQGKELAAIANFLGHYSLSSTDHYLRRHFGKKQTTGKAIIDDIVKTRESGQKQETSGNVVNLHDRNGKGRDDDIPY